MKKTATTWLLCIPTPGTSSFCIYREPRAEEQARERCIKHGRQLHLAGKAYDGLDRKQAREKWAASLKVEGSPQAEDSILPPEWPYC